jgi:hypothetical protein
MKERFNPREQISASMQMRGAHPEQSSVRGFFTVVCRNKRGRIKWRERIDNLVTTVGKNDLLNKFLNGSSYTASFRMGLKGTGSAAAGDTQASHAGWSEVGGTNAPAYSGNRKTPTMGAASSGVSTSSAEVFTFTSGGTVAGVFTNNGGSATKDDTSGVLFSAGDFSGGSRVVQTSDTLTITYTLTVS